MEWLESHLIPCFYKSLFGIECPGCGMQRAFIELLKGNFIESIKIYSPLIPILVMFIFLILHLIFKLKKGATILTFMFIFAISFIMINYIYKLLN